MKPMSPLNQKSRAERIAAKKKQGKKVKLPGPAKLLFGHAIVDNQLTLVANPAAGTAEHHAVNHKVLKAHFDAAKVSRKWPTGAEISEEAFLSAIDAVANAKVR